MARVNISTINNTNSLGGYMNSTGMTREPTPAEFHTAVDTVYSAIGPIPGHLQTDEHERVIQALMERRAAR